MQVFSKRFWPFYLLILILVVYFYPVWLQGLHLLPSDLIVGGYHPWLDYKWGNVVGVGVKNPILSDVVSIVYPLRELFVELVKQGELPVWNWGMFAGYPLLANLQLGMLFPSTIFYLFLPTLIAWDFHIILQPVIALLGMYLFLRHLKLNQFASLFGAISFGLGGFMAIFLEWGTLGMTGCFLPWLFLFGDSFLTKPTMRKGLAISIIVCLQLLTGYLQVVVFSYGLLGLLIVIKRYSFKNILLLVPFFLLGAGLSAIELLPGMEFFQLSQRRFEVIDANLKFLPLQNLLVLFAPDFFGNHATANFWGEGNYTINNLYTGIICLVFALIGLLTTYRSIWVKFFGIATLLTILVMVPSPISRFLYDLGLWGGPAASTTRAGLIVNFSLATMAAFGFQSLTKERVKKHIFAHIFILLVVCLIMGGVYYFRAQIRSSGGVTFSDPYIITDKAIQIANLGVSMKNLIVPLGLVGLSLLVLLSLKIKKIPLIATQLLLILLVCFELFRFGWKFNVFTPEKYVFPPTPITEFLEKEAPVRFTGGDVIPSNMWVPYNLESVASYDAIYPIWWGDYINLINNEALPTEVATRYGLVNRFDTIFFDMTATKYSLSLKRNKFEIPSSDGQIQVAYRIPKFKQVFEEKSVAVLENTQAFPRAYLVTNVLQTTPNQVMSLMLERKADLRTLAIVEEDGVALQSTPDNNLPIPTYTHLANNHVQLKTEAAVDSFLVVLDSYYPDWKVTIDGKPDHLYRTNHVYRGVKVPAGSHTIDMTYNPLSLKVGAGVTLISLVIVGGLFTWSKYKKK